MIVLCGLTIAGRNCIRLTPLASWGKYHNPYRSYVEALNGHECIVNKCRSLKINSNTGFCSVTGSSNFYRNIINKNPGCLLNAKNAERCKFGSNCPSKSYFSFSQPLLRKTVVRQTCSPWEASNHTQIWAVQIIRPFHTSPVSWAAPLPVFWLLLKPVQKLAAILLGRSIRKWWKALPPNKKEHFKESVRKNKWKILLSFCGLGIIFIMFYFTHLEETPITGRSRLLVFGKEHLLELSQLEYEMWMEEFEDKMLPETDPRYKVVQKVISHISESNQDIPEVSEFKWVIHVVEEPGINAFVLPNGQVFVFTGLLSATSDVHQLSFILGHEIAHAVLGHAAERASLVHLLDFLSLIFLTAIWAVCPQDILALGGHWIQEKLKEFMFDKPYSRTLEAEADKVGLQLVAKACVDVRASSVFWQQMELAETMKGYPKIPEWLSTHPSHENRAEHLDRLIPEALKIRERCNCPALSGQDPRLIFRLSMQHLLEASDDKESSNVTHRAFEEKKVKIPFIQKEKIPVAIVVENEPSS